MSIKIIGRHGETKRNAGKPVYRGWDEEPENQLSEEGLEDAEYLGKCIKKECKNPKEWIIVTSDLQRARDTGIIASEVSGIKLGKKYYDLRSMDTGSFTGKPVHLHQKTIDDHVRQKPHLPLDGGSESYNDFIKRTKGAFEKKLIEDYPDKDIIVITHHQVEVLHANDFEYADDTMYKHGILPGTIRMC
jgi:broad specificity phosphatase PhoE